MRLLRPSHEPTASRTLLGSHQHREPLVHPRVGSRMGCPRSAEFRDGEGIWRREGASKAPLYAASRLNQRLPCQPAYAKTPNGHPKTAKLFHSPFAKQAKQNNHGKDERCDPQEVWRGVEERCGA